MANTPMATSAPRAVPQPHDDRHDRQARRRPFSTWMKKLGANFKNNATSSSDNGSHHGHSRKTLYQMKTQGKRPSKNNNPYPQSGRIAPPHTHNSLPSFSTEPTSAITSTSAGSLGDSPRSSLEGHHAPTTGARSTIAPTVCTEHDAAHSMMAPSHGGTSTAGTRTVGGGVEYRRGDSTFSSPAPSVRSLTTTLTTIQSMAVNGGNAHGNHSQAPGAHHPLNQLGNSVQFTQPFPTTAMSPSPASAIPPHLAPQPTTYSTATANNLLTDNASILTLASSSKRRRRRSFDTDASVRALAPSSLWGGSRESLPLSVLSANVVDGVMPPTPSALHTTSRMAAERTSIYSATGVVPALNSERNSYYAKQSIAGGAGDTASVRSVGLLGHTRADSTTGSIAGLGSPLASPKEENLLENGEKEDSKTDVVEKEKEKSKE